MNFIDPTKSILENAYYISGILISLSLIIGLIQIFYTKKSLIINSRRNAASFAAKQVEIYLNNIISLQNEYFDKKKLDKVESLDLEIKEFNIISLKEQIGDKKFIEYGKTHIKYLDYSLKVLNSMEAFSVYFIKKIADEEIAFSSVGVTFIFTVKYLYYDICFCRAEKNSKSFQNLIKLYEIWESRISKEKLEIESENLKTKLKEIKTEKINPLGTK